MARSDGDSRAGVGAHRAGHLTLWTESQLRALIEALHDCREALPADADPQHVSRLQDLERRLDELIGDLSAATPTRLRSGT